MLAVDRYSNYDPFARIYNESWGPEYCQEKLPLLKTLFLQHLPAKAHIFDLCCGTGQIAQQLLLQGYQVTGLDGSEMMLHYARENAPNGHFILEDARSFQFSSIFHGVVSTSSAFNHLTNLEDLTQVFHNVCNSLLECGIFVFDINLNEQYQSSNGILSGDVQDEYAWASRTIYHSDSKTGQIYVTTFQRIEGVWQRFDLHWSVKTYSTSEIESALKSAGFNTIKFYDEEQDLGVSGGIGKAFYVCRK
jgi:SAM-dependent methyltransferase